MAKTIIGNWKMNAGAPSASAWMEGMKNAVAGINANQVHIGVCVPMPYLSLAQSLLSGNMIRYGAQNLSEHDSGAYTGEVSGGMLKTFDCHFVIVGHSERRAMYGESDDIVAKKSQAALKAGLTPIVCVGETLSEREAGQTDTVVLRQLQAVINVVGAKAFASSALIAYEPVWAIGTGKTATPDMAEAVHSAIYECIAQHDVSSAKTCTILYGGSMKGDNAASLLAMSHIHGGLIGGASLKVDDFMAIVKAAI